MQKLKKILGLGLVVIITLIAVNIFIKANEEIGATISGSIGGIGTGDNEKFSKEEKDFLNNICLSKRKHGIDINSEDARALGKSTNDMMISVSSKTGVFSTKTYNYNLWIGSKIGYIQNKDDTRIYKLSSDESKFFIDSYLKYYTKNEVESMISKKY